MIRSERNIFIPCVGEKSVQQLTQDLIIKINQINELNIYKFSLFKDLYTTEYIDRVDSLVLEELAILHNIQVQLPKPQIDGNWLMLDFKWGRIFVIANIKLS